MADAPVTGGPLPAAPSLAGVAQNTGDQQAQVLGAMARYGQAGLDAYNQAQNNVIAQRQSVLDSVARAQGISPDASALIASKVQASTQPALTDLQSGQANLQADLARGNDMYTRYAGEANAALPVIQANQQTQMGIRDQALQLAQQQIDAQKAADAAKNAHDLQIQQMQLQAEQARAEQAKAARDAALAKASTPKAATAGELSKVVKDTTNIAAAYGPNTTPSSAGRTRITDDMMMAADDLAAFNRTSPQLELAKIVAQQEGIPVDQAEQYLNSGTVAGIDQSKALNPPPPPDVKSAAKFIGGDTGGATAVLNGSRWGAVQDAVNAIANAPRDINGLISDGSSFNGMTPEAAFSKWVTSPAANLAPGDTKTPQIAMGYYKPFLSGLK